MQVITVATDVNNEGFTNFLKPSCEFYKLNLLVLQYGDSFFSNRLKDALLENYLKEVHDDEIIFFTDATDAAFLCGEDEILKKLYGFNSQLVFSAEVNCWPDRTMEATYPSSSTHFKYLNSGGFIGRAGFIKQLYQRYPISITANHPQYNWSNQYYWNYIFIKEHETIKLDHNCEIFYNTSILLDDINDFKARLQSTEQVQAMYNAEKQRLDKEIISTNYRVKSHATGSLPCHIHFPGPISKLLMDNGYFNTMKAWEALPHSSSK